MRFLSVGVAAFILSVSVPGNASPTGMRSTNGSIRIAVRGWGRVVLGSGFLDKHHSIPCRRTFCAGSTFASSGLRVVAKARPMEGWKFMHWRGACKSQSRKCTINFEHVRPNRLGYGHVRLTAVFTTAAPGSTRAWPVPLGQTATTDKMDSLRLRVNSVTPKASVSPAAPAGADYFVANITATYEGRGSSDLYSVANSMLATVGTEGVPYDAAVSGCPHDGPAPQLDTLGPLYSGQSATGNVCWTIIANDASSLVLYFDGGAHMTWLALHN